MELSSSKIKKLLIFLEIRISSLKYLLYFRRGISELKKKIHSEKVSYILGNGTVQPQA